MRGAKKIGRGLLVPWSHLVVDKDASTEFAKDVAVQMRTIDFQNVLTKKGEADIYVAVIKQHGAEFDGGKPTA